MSGLDYTKKLELRNTSDGLPPGEGSGKGLWHSLRVGVYKLVFLSRTRLEKWLLYLSLAFGLVGLGISLFLISTISKPAPITVSCDLEKLREIVNERPVEHIEEAAIKTEAKPVTEPKKTRKTPKTLKKEAKKSG